jgi:hypothetical protein
MVLSIMQKIDQDRKIKFLTQDNNKPKPDGLDYQTKIVTKVIAP